MKGHRKTLRYLFLLLLTIGIAFVIFPVHKASAEDSLVWTKYPLNPVMSAGPSTAWDGFMVRAGAVLKEGSTYKMWYIGASGTTSIGLATSSDGKTWTKYANNPVLSGTNQAWDAGVARDTVIYDPDEGLYKMWYQGNGNNNPGAIGYATSPDGINWTKYSGNPVLERSNSSWDQAGIGQPTVLKIGSTYHLWYAGDSNNVGRIGHATSSNGINWTKDAANPVLSSSQAWEEDSPVTGNHGLGGPSVLYDGTTYRMWYYAGAPGGIGMATSTDGVTWTKLTTNPIIPKGSQGEWDYYHLINPIVIYDGTNYKLWYEGAGDAQFIYHIGYATTAREPLVGVITAPSDPVALGTAITASASFTDPGPVNTHTAVWNWGDNTTSPGTVTEANSNGSVTDSHTYTQAGVYTLKLSVTDSDGNTGENYYSYVVIYDPAVNKLFTGNGSIDSPQGAYLTNPTAVGKARFGLVAKYLQGVNNPDGHFNFKFAPANVDFKSTSFEWLVITGDKAQLKGTGTINDTGTYKFLVTGMDSATDTIRVKIWIDNASQTVVYDNQLGDPDTADATQPIDTGNVLVQ